MKSCIIKNNYANADKGADPMKTLSIKSTFIILIPLIIIVGLGYRTNALGAISCHCFNDRDYNPADRFAADDYILATSFNSLLAKYFAVPKGQIIMLKMNEGVPEDDLLIGLKVAHTTGEDVNKLLGLRRAGKTWQEVIAGMEQQDKLRNDPILHGIISGVEAGQAGRDVVDEIISQFYAIPVEEITKLRKAGLSEKEITLVFILVHVSNQKTATLLAQHNEHNKSWSEIAHNLGIEPAEAGKLIMAYPAKQINE